MSRGLALGGFKRRGVGDWRLITSSGRKERRVVFLGLATTSPPPDNICNPGVMTGWADRWSEIFLTFSCFLQHVSLRCRCWTLYRGAPERMINHQSPDPSPLEQQSGSSTGNKEQILSPKHSQGYNEACTKQTEESWADKQFHIQSSTAS